MIIDKVLLKGYISLTRIDIGKEVINLRIKYSNEADVLLKEMLDASKFVPLDEFNIIMPTRNRKEIAAHA
jgi:hypothetical protein